MRATTLINTASLYRGKTVSRAEAIATKMREIGLLPKGGRGLSAPALSAMDAAAFLLALAGAERVDDVPVLMSQLREMVDEAGQFVVPTLGAIIQSPETAKLVRRVLVIASAKMVEIEYDDRPTRWFFPPHQWSPGFKPEAQGEGFVGPIGMIGGAVLHQVAVDFRDDDMQGELVGE